MAKRDTEIEPIEDEEFETDLPTVGERLRSAREGQDLSLEDVAAQTRIPQRHLESIENGEWDKLPAPTYTIGFAKSYAAAVGLDRADIGNQLREEMGGQRFTSNQAEVFEPADPARTMPKWLVIAAVVAVILLIVLMSWINRRSLDDSGQPAPAAVATPSQPAPQPTPPAAPPATAGGPVVLTATAMSWIQVTDQGKSLFEGELAPGQTYAVPPTAVAPELKAGKPETLKIMVGSAVAPPVGAPGKVASHVSLKPADLMAGPQQPAPAAAPPAQ